MFNRTRDDRQKPPNIFQIIANIIGWIVAAILSVFFSAIGF